MVRDKQMVFWTFLFPIILATLFSMAFTNLSSNETFHKINISVVDNAEYRDNTSFQNALSSVSDTPASSGGEELFHITLATKEQADASLKSNDIVGYILFDNGAHVVVKQSGIQQTILKEFMDHYLQTSSAITTILNKNPDALQNLLSDTSGSNTYLQEVSPTKAAPNNTLVYYYALIAMACMYGGFLGMKEVAAVQANLSSQGARVNLAPVHKLKIFGYSLCAATVMQLLSVLTLVAYLGFILKVDFGNQLGYILLACAASCCMGVSLGAMIGSLIKKSEALQTATLIAVSMVLSFLSGLMVVEMKYIVTNAVPAMAYINPANLTADAFYSLYYYNTHTRYFINVGLLFGFSVLFYLVVYFVMRRQKYASL